MYMGGMSYVKRYFGYIIGSRDGCKLDGKIWRKTYGAGIEIRTVLWPQGQDIKKYIFTER